MDVKTAIETGDAVALAQLLAGNAALANELIRWGENGRISTHPLHYVCDMLFNGVLPKGKELPLIDALIAAGADVDFRKPGKGETALIGAASLGAEDVGLRLLDAGADPALAGIFGETALHWAGMMGEDRLAARLVAGADLNLKDKQYDSSPLGWCVHGWHNPPKGNQGRQIEIARCLVAAGATIEPRMLEAVRAHGDSAILAVLEPSPPSGSR
jgi:hypothetical protein